MKPYDPSTPSPSHHYQLKGTDIAKLLMGPLLTILFVAIGLHLAPRMGFIPSPRPRADIDQAILTHKIDASRSSAGIQLVLAGDSSCLMNVDARKLSHQLGHPALNLGTLSYLDLRAHTELIRQAISHNAPSVHTILLLMHPEALRRSTSESYQTDIFYNYLTGKDTVPAGTGANRIRSLLGLHILQGRIADRLFPRPLGGDYGRAYGFLSGVELYMNEHDGSLMDPTTDQARGNPEYFLTPSLEEMSRDLRASIPRSVQFVVGITPLPQNYVDSDYEALHQSMLLQWAEWLEADHVLIEMPAVMPPQFFANKTHLNQEGVEYYTSRLSAILDRLPRRSLAHFSADKYHASNK